MSRTTKPRTQVRYIDPNDAYRFYEGGPTPAWMKAWMCKEGLNWKNKEDRNLFKEKFLFRQQQSGEHMNHQEMVVFALNAMQALHDSLMETEDGYGGDFIAVPPAALKKFVDDQAILGYEYKRSLSDAK